MADIDPRVVITGMAPDPDDDGRVLVEALVPAGMDPDEADALIQRVARDRMLAVFAYLFPDSNTRYQAEEAITTAEQ